MEKNAGSHLLKYFKKILQLPEVISVASEYVELDNIIAF